MAGCDILLQGASYAALALTGCMITLQAVIALHDVLTTALFNFIAMCAVLGLAVVAVEHRWVQPLGAARRNGRRNLAISQTRGVCILFVMLIHCACESTLQTFLCHRRVINRAVPVLVFLMGTTAAYQQHRTLSWAASRVKKMLPTMWAFLLFAWAYRISYSRWIDFVLFVTHGEARPRLLVGLSFIGYAPCLGGAWFFTLAIEVYLFVLLVGKSGSWYPLLLAFVVCSTLVLDARFELRTNEALLVGRGVGVCM